LQQQAGLTVERAERLVHQKNIRLDGKGARHGDALGGASGRRRRRDTPRFGPLQTRLSSMSLLTPAMSAFEAVDGSSTRHVSAVDVSANKASTIRRSSPSKRLLQSVWTSRSLFSRFMASMLRPVLSSAGMSSDAKFQGAPDMMRILIVFLY
jgi:hypothetical protein